MGVPSFAVASPAVTRWVPISHMQVLRGVRISLKFRWCAQPFLGLRFLSHVPTLYAQMANSASVMEFRASRFVTVFTPFFQNVPVFPGCQPNRQFDYARVTARGHQRELHPHLRVDHSPALDCKLWRHVARLSGPPAVFPAVRKG